jgi:serine/threonine-protein kinase
MRGIGASVLLPDRYQDARLIATGGMGQIYCARDTALGRVVAIKLLDDRFAADPTLRKRFEREALAAARLSSDPNTITIFDVGECEGRPFIVMEYLPSSIEDVLRESGAQPPSRALDWLAQAAAALDHAHEHDVVHRDVKPANLLLTEDGRVQVADFGVARALGLDSVTQTGTIIGTAGYLSPEQAEGKTATPASDRYSLGVVGFELLSGWRPFERGDPAFEAAARAQAPVPSISTYRTGPPSEMDAVFERALAKNPAARFPTCADFVGAVRAADARTVRPTRTTAAPFVRSDRPTIRVRPSGSSGTLGRSPVPFLVGALLLAAGALTAVMIARSDGDRRAGPVVRVTVTEMGTTTILRTVRERPSPPATTASPAGASRATPAASGTSSPSSIALQGYQLMRAGDYAGAFPLLQQAATGLQGTGSLAQAYNDYNLAFTLTKIQGCSSRVIQLLNASEAIQGQQKPIDDLRNACKR